MARLLIIFAITVLWPLPLALPQMNLWIVWNVGQGEWVTWVTGKTCLHFDMGGEKWSKSKLQRLCGDKSNFAYFTHWDLDHIGFAARARSALPNLCLARAPLGPTNHKKAKLLADLKSCQADPQVQIWIPASRVTGMKKTANELCQIYTVERKMLITGDAPQAEERQALNSGLNITSVRWLVLGHHGSRTSTSEQLLQALPNLRMAIATARHQKYGHPHLEVLERLRRYRIPLLRTEDWGDIAIED